MTENTNDTSNTDVSGKTNDKDVDTGAGTDTSKDDKNQEETLTKAQVNEVVKRAKADAERSAKAKFDKSLEGKHILTEDEKTQLYKTIETEVRNKIAMENKRAEYKSKGLTDIQLDTVTVDKLEDYDKRVNELFGAILKKNAPVLNGGNTNNTDEATNNNASFAQRQQARLNEMKKKANIK